MLEVNEEVDLGGVIVDKALHPPRPCHNATDHTHNANARLRGGRWRVPMVAVVTNLQPEENLGLDHIQLVGMKRVASSSEHWARRVLWAVFLVSGLIGMLFLNTHRILLYLSNPVSVRVSYTTSSSIALPAITVCLKEKYDFHNLLALWKITGQQNNLPEDGDLQLLDLSNLTLREVWEGGGYKLNSLVRQCYVGPGGRCEDQGAWTPILSRYGLCYTFSGATTYMTGTLFGIYLKLAYRGHPYGLPFQGYIVAVHNPGVPISQAIEDGISCPQKLTKHRRKLGCHRLVSVSLQRIHLMNGPERPCSEHRTYSTEACRASCLYTHILHQCGCRLPYMQVTGKECHSRIEIQKVENLVHYLFFKGNFNYSMCDCPPACSSTIYRRNADTTWNSNKYSVIKVYLEGAQYEEVVESYAYSTSALVSHIGGFMGLLLGASILSCLQTFELLLHRIRHLLHRLLRLFTQCKDNLSHV